MQARIIEVSAPEYNVEERPDYLSIGKKVDKAIESHLPDGKYILRAIGSQDHPGLSLGQLADVVINTGTDKYDPKRKAVCHDEFSGYDYDIQAGTIEIRNGRLVIPDDYKYKSEFADIIWHFYEHTQLDRGYAVRIDLLLLYDPKQLKRARKLHPKARSVGRGLNKYLYKFTLPERKKEALVALVKILR